MMTDATSCTTKRSDWLNITNGCPIEWDGVKCWPITEPGSIATLPCFSSMEGINDNGEAATVSRTCLASGKWMKSANYATCVDSPPLYLENGETVAFDGPTIIYVVGYLLSVVFLTFSALVYIISKDLRCVRNSIHINLFFTYISTGILWLLSLLLQLLWTHESSQAVCGIFMALHYCHSATFYWMFVEGHFLYNQVVRALYSSPPSLRIYMLIGWGSPFSVILVWMAVKLRLWSTGSIGDYLSAASEFLLSQNQPDKNDVNRTEQKYIENFTHLENGLNEELMSGEWRCPWLKFDLSDWIYVLPCLILLVVNALYLTRIMWTLIGKLRDSSHDERHQYIKYRKAAKALLVLLPLLGGTYILVLISPFQTGTLATLFAHLQALLISTQGLAVALVLCFINGEVHKSVVKRYRRWRHKRSFSHRKSYRSSRPTEAFELKEVGDL